MIEEPTAPTSVSVDIDQSKVDKRSAYLRSLVKSLKSFLWRRISEPTLLQGYFLFVLLIGLFSLSFYVFVVISCIRWILPVSLPLCIVYLALFCPSWALLVISYLRTCFTSGEVVNDKTFDVEDDAVALGCARFCKKCDLMRPERAHHCSICGHCVLRLDHHCPYVLGDVGLRNHKFFYLMLFWADLTCIVLIFGMIQTVTLASHSFSTLFSRPQPFILQDEFLVVTIMAIAALVILLLVPFTIFHTMLILKNKTTIEKFNNERMMTTTGEFVHPYDIGYRRNWKAIMGDHFYVWFLPIKVHQEFRGLSYARHPGFEEPGPRAVAGLSVADRSTSKIIPRQSPVIPAPFVSKDVMIVQGRFEGLLPINATVKNIQLDDCPSKERGSGILENV